MALQLLRAPHSADLIVFSLILTVFRGVVGARLSHRHKQVSCCIKYKQVPVRLPCARSCDTPSPGCRSVPSSLSAMPTIVRITSAVLCTHGGVTVTLQLRAPVTITAVSQTLSCTLHARRLQTHDSSPEPCLGPPQSDMRSPAFHTRASLDPCHLLGLVHTETSGYVHTETSNVLAVEKACCARRRLAWRVVYRSRLIGSGVVICALVCHPCNTLVEVSPAIVDPTPGSMYAMGH